jgi:hypothetical protein
VIVTRGLGLGGILVTAGLALSLGVIVVPPEVLPQYLSDAKRIRQFVKTEIAVTVSIPAVQGRGLLADIEAKGSASVGLFMEQGRSKVNIFKPTGAATARVIGVSSSSKLGQILASGKHDMEDEELLGMLLALLES